MTTVLTLTTREVRGYFITQAGYIVTALFMLLIGGVFIARTFEQGQPASMRPVFELGTWLLLLVCPAISMRAISEERRLGTFEMLMTSPVSDGQVILAKFLAGMVFLLLMLTPTLLHVGLLEYYGRPDYGELACGYLGLLLAGAVYLASGLLASTLTTSQVVAFVLTLFFWLTINLGMKFLPPYLEEPWASAAFALDPDPRLRDFAIGLIDTSNVVYFISLTGVFLIAAKRALETRRWG